jgi:hypothetical protein
MQSLLLGRHGLEGIIELGATLTTNPVRSPANGEDTAEIVVMAAKQEVE